MLVSQGMGQANDRAGDDELNRDERGVNSFRAYGPPALDLIPSTNQLKWENVFVTSGNSRRLPT